MQVQQVGDSQPVNYACPQYLVSVICILPEIKNLISLELATCF
jgi:hypothetical protein